MIIQINIDYTLAAAPPPAYQLFFYYRKVGDISYTQSTLSTPSISGTHTITIVSNMDDVIQDINYPCSLEYEGYMIPSCFVGTPEETSEKVDFTFSVPVTSLTDYQICRGIDATCTTGAVVGVRILDDPDTYSISAIHWDAALFTPPTWILVTGSGDVNNLPTFGQNDNVGGDGIIMDYTYGGTSSVPNGTNVSLANNTLGSTVFHPIIPVRTNSEAISTNNGFDATTVVQIQVEDDDAILINLDCELILACGAIETMFYCGDDGTASRKTSFTPLGETTKYCLYNKGGTGDPGFEESAFQDLYTTEQYTCCQSTECRSYTATYIANQVSQVVGQGGVNGGITSSIPLEYLDLNRDRQVITLSIGVAQTIFAIENTVRPFTNNTSSSPASSDLVVNNILIAFSDPSYFTLVDNGPCEAP